MTDSIIRVRFVRTKGIAGDLIALQAGIAMPFTPIHVESVTPDGFYFGQHICGGMQKRPAGYDANELIHEKFVAVRCTAKQVAAYYAYLDSKENQPYDWTSILSFVDPALNLHQFNHLICSAITTAAFRTEGCEIFPWPLTVPFHHISPRDLLLMLSALTEISHEMP
jgi:hypothetical protein